MKVLRLLICSSEYPPYGSGIGMVVYHLKKELEKMGISTTLLSPKSNDIKCGSWLFILKTGRIGLLHFWLRTWKYISNNWKKYDKIWLHQPIFLYKKYPPNIICTYQIVATGVYGYIKKANVSPLIRLYKKFNALIERKSVEKVNTLETKIVAPNNSVKNQLIKLNLPAASINVITNGVNVEIYKPRKNKKAYRNELNIPLDRKVIAFIGRLTRPKNPWVLIEIFESLNNLNSKSDDYFFIVVGRGELFHTIKKYAHSKKITNIRFFRDVPYKKMYKFFNCADAYILPSLYEGQPLTLLEAMASGLPCIVSQIRSLSNLIGESGSGIIIDTKDVITSAIKIHHFLSSPEQASQAGLNARMFIEKHFSWEIKMRQYLCLMNEKKKLIS